METFCNVVSFLVAAFVLVITAAAALVSLNKMENPNE